MFIIIQQFILSVFLVDTGKQVFVWIGRETSSEEKKNAMTYAHVSNQSDTSCTLRNYIHQQNYLKDTDHPLVPISCIKSGSENDTFKNSF